MNVREDIFDVLIIGAGPIGLACGIEAQRRQMRHVIIEKGCLVNSIFHYPTNMTFFSTSDRLEIGEVPFISHGNKPTRREALEYYRRVAGAWKLNVRIYEKVLEISGEAGDFTLQTDKAVYRSRTLIVATGFYDNPNLMGIPGEDLPKVKHYYNEPHPYTFRKVAVIGAGNSAVDVALETFRCDAEVTMIVREPELKEGIKYWVKPDIENRIAEGSIKAYFNSTVEAIRENEIDIVTPDGKVTLQNDFVLAMTGYHSDFDLLNKAAINLVQNEWRTPEFDETTFETSTPGLFLAGVVCGGMETTKWIIENSREHAVRIFNFLENTYNRK